MFCCLFSSKAAATGAKVKVISLNAGEEPVALAELEVAADDGSPAPLDVGGGAALLGATDGVDFPESLFGGI